MSRSRVLLRDSVRRGQAVDTELKRPPRTKIYSSVRPPWGTGSG